VIFALLACSATPDDRLAYTEGLHATDYAAAWAACGRVADAQARGDCQAATAQRFFVFEDCDSIEAAQWRGECRFVQSETLGRAGDLPGALEACRRSGFGAQCDDHVIGLLAGLHATDDVATIASRFDSLRGTLVNGGVEGPFWGHYFRNRLMRGLPVEVDACPPGPCRPVAQREVGAAVHEAARRSGSTPSCDGSEAFPPWATTEVVRGWVVEERARLCAPPGAPPPPRPR
jgi:hypothetical protein